MSNLHFPVFHTQGALDRVLPKLGEILDRRHPPSVFLELSDQQIAYLKKFPPNHFTRLTGEQMAGYYDVTGTRPVGPNAAISHAVIGDFLEFYRHVLHYCVDRGYPVKGLEKADHVRRLIDGEESPSLHAEREAHWASVLHPVDGALAIYGMHHWPPLRGLSKAAKIGAKSVYDPKSYRQRPSISRQVTKLLSKIFG